MKKYKFSALCIEITRRCNRKCLHCMRGEAQEITMSEEVINKVFQDIQDVTQITFGSGEALLEVDRILYFINKLINSSWTTKKLAVITNGTIKDSRIIDAFKDYCINKNGMAYLDISSDQFHDKAECKQAYEYYAPLVETANREIRQHQNRSGIVLDYVNSADEALIYTGRAVQLVESGTTQFEHGKNVGYFPYYKHRIKIVDNAIPCGLQILANGNITFMEVTDYNKLDEISFGNILVDDVSNLIAKHNENCMLLCSEIDMLQKAQELRYRPINSELSLTQTGFIVFPKQEAFIQLMDRIHLEIIKLRYEYRKCFPHVPADLIISSIPFPKYSEALHIVIGLGGKLKNTRTILQKLKNCSENDTKLGCIDEICKELLKVPELPVPMDFLRRKSNIFNTLSFYDTWFCRNPDKSICVSGEVIDGNNNSNFRCAIDVLDIDYHNEQDSKEYLTYEQLIEEECRKHIDTLFTQSNDDVDLLGENK